MQSIFNGYRNSFPVVKQPRRNVGPSPLSTAEVKMYGAITRHTTYAILARKRTIFPYHTFYILNISLHKHEERKQFYTGS
jgi:hypothetical protein